MVSWFETARPVVGRVFVAHRDGLMLERLEVPQSFVAHEVAAMSEGCYAKTVSRSVLGSLTALASLADYQRWVIAANDLAANSALPARTPCSPLYGSHVSPDREVRALAQDWAHGADAGCSSAAF